MLEAVVGRTARLPMLLKVEPKLVYWPEAGVCIEFLRMPMVQPPPSVLMSQTTRIGPCWAPGGSMK